MTLLVTRTPGSGPTLASAGIDLIGWARSAEPLLRQARDLQQSGGNLQTLQAELVRVGSQLKGADLLGIASPADRRILTRFCEESEAIAAERTTDWSPLAEAHRVAATLTGVLVRGEGTGVFAAVAHYQAAPALEKKRARPYERHRPGWALNATSLFGAAIDRVKSGLVDTLGVGEKSKLAEPLPVLENVAQTVFGDTLRFPKTTTEGYQNIRKSQPERISEAETFVREQLSRMTAVERESFIKTHLEVFLPGARRHQQEVQQMLDAVESAGGIPDFTPVNEAQVEVDRVVALAIAAGDIPTGEIFEVHYYRRRAETFTGSEAGRRFLQRTWLLREKEAVVRYYADQASALDMTAHPKSDWDLLDKKAKDTAALYDTVLKGIDEGVSIDRNPAEELDPLAPLRREAIGATHWNTATMTAAWEAREARRLTELTVSSQWGPVMQAYLPTAAEWSRVEDALNIDKEAADLVHQLVRFREQTRRLLQAALESEVSATDRGGVVNRIAEFVETGKEDTTQDAYSDLVARWTDKLKPLQTLRAAYEKSVNEYLDYCRKFKWDINGRGHEYNSYDKKAANALAKLQLELEELYKEFTKVAPSIISPSVLTQFRLIEQCLRGKETSGAPLEQFIGSVASFGGPVTDEVGFEIPGTGFKLVPGKRLPNARTLLSGYGAQFGHDVLGTEVAHGDVIFGLTGQARLLMNEAPTELVRQALGDGSFIWLLAGADKVWPAGMRLDPNMSRMALTWQGIHVSTYDFSDKPSLRLWGILFLQFLQSGVKVMPVIGPGAAVAGEVIDRKLGAGGAYTQRRHGMMTGRPLGAYDFGSRSPRPRAYHPYGNYPEVDPTRSWDSYTDDELVEMLHSLYLVRSPHTGLSTGMSAKTMIEWSDAKDAAADSGEVGWLSVLVTNEGEIGTEPSAGVSPIRKPRDAAAMIQENTDPYNYFNFPVRGRRQIGFVTPIPTGAFRTHDQLATFIPQAFAPERGHDLSVDERRFNNIQVHAHGIRGFEMLAIGSMHGTRIPEMTTLQRELLAQVRRMSPAEQSARLRQDMLRPLMENAGRAPTMTAAAMVAVPRGPQPLRAIDDQLLGGLVTSMTLEEALEIAQGGLP